MPPRFTYWTILIDGQPTAFRAHQQADLLPTLVQIRRANPSAEMKWFARGRIWESPAAAAQAQTRQRSPNGRRARTGLATWRSAQRSPCPIHTDPRRAPEEICAQAAGKETDLLKCESREPSPETRNMVSHVVLFHLRRDLGQAEHEAFVHALEVALRDISDNSRFPDRPARHLWRRLREGTPRLSNSAVSSTSTILPASGRTSSTLRTKTSAHGSTRQSKRGSCTTTRWEGQPARTFLQKLDAAITTRDEDVTG